MNNTLFERLYARGSLKGNPIVDICNRSARYRVALSFLVQLLWLFLEVEDLGDRKILSTTVVKAKGVDESWVFCSTIDSFLFYPILWGN